MQKLALIFISIFFLQPFIFQPIETQSTIVFCEVATATWCKACPLAERALYSIYSSGNYPFYYVNLVTDRNMIAFNRCQKYNFKYLPTCFFDGGYKVVVGGYTNEKPYKEAIEDCLNRERKNILVYADAKPIDSKGIEIKVNIKNIEKEEYKGILKIYAVEINSRWRNSAGEPYHFAFLDFAINKNFTIHSYENYNISVIWKNNWDVSLDNLVFFIIVFNQEKHIGYSDPPENNRSFIAYYPDNIAVAPINKLLIKITKPLGGYIYVFNRETFKLPTRKAIVIGKITMVASVIGRANKVEFYIVEGGKERKIANFSTPPYEVIVDEKTGLYSLKAIAYGEETVTDSCRLLIINFDSQK